MCPSTLAVTLFGGFQTWEHRLQLLFSSQTSQHPGQSHEIPIQCRLTPTSEVISSTSPPSSPFYQTLNLLCIYCSIDFPQVNSGNYIFNFYSGSNYRTVIFYSFLFWAELPNNPCYLSFELHPTRLSVVKLLGLETQECPHCRLWLTPCPSAPPGHMVNLHPWGPSSGWKHSNLAWLLSTLCTHWKSTSQLFICPNTCFSKWESYFLMTLFCASCFFD